MNQNKNCSCKRKLINNIILFPMSYNKNVVLFLNVNTKHTESLN